jgi:hypothetical protein
MPLPWSFSGIWIFHATLPVTVKAIASEVSREKKYREESREQPVPPELSTETFYASVCWMSDVMWCESWMNSLFYNAQYRKHWCVKFICNIIQNELGEQSFYYFSLHYYGITSYSNTLYYTLKYIKKILYMFYRLRFIVLWTTL